MQSKGVYSELMVTLFFLGLLPIFLGDTSDLYYVLSVLELLWVKVASGLQGLIFFFLGVIFITARKRKKKRGLKRASSWVLPGWNHAFHLWKTGMKGTGGWTSGFCAFMVLPFTGSSEGRAKSQEGTMWVEASLKLAFGGSQKGISPHWQGDPAISCSSVGRISAALVPA